MDRPAAGGRKHRVAGILLAAGRGRRCGGNKLLLRLGGRPLIDHSLGGCLASTLDAVIVVLPSRAGALAEAILRSFPDAGKVRIVENEARDRGMMSSLKAGIRALDGRYRGAMVLLADMPRIGPEIIDPLVGVFEERGGIVIPECRGDPTHPRILPAHLFPEFLRLGDDERGTVVLERHREEIVRVAVGAKIDYVDVDRAGDLDAIVGDFADRAESKREGSRGGAPRPRGRRPGVWTGSRPDVQREDPLLIERDGHSEILLGNEAIVRGALEAGVAFASGYPGTPSSEITDSFARVAAARGIVFEYSVNEKVALEMAFAASLSGARSICAMKHLGLLVAGDPLSTIPYVGVEGGMVIVSAGDPGCGTSPNEQDQRLLGPLLHVPILDPGTPREARDMTRFAFGLSEESRLPVILRATTHVCHTRAAVAFGPLAEPRVAGFTPDPPRYVPIPVNARRMRIELKDRMERARELMAVSGFFRRRGVGPDVVIAAGAPAATCADLLDEYGLEDRVAFWSLGTVYPLPEAQIVEALRGVERVLVVEELTPFLEDAIQLICARHRLDVEIVGKRTGHLPDTFNYTPEVIGAGLRKGLGLPLPEKECAGERTPVPPRPPTLCPGCPHRAAFFAARMAFDEDQLYFSDIGCYTLGYGEPLETADALLCMGAGFTLAAGVSRMTGRRTVGFVGDSTFFHAGVPPLINAIKEGVNMIAVILDNGVTAMTGFQETPGAREEHSISIERVVRALGVEQVEKVNPFDTTATVAAFHRAREGRGTSVVIIEGGCPAHVARQGRPTGGAVVYEVDAERCRACGQEGSGLRCAQPMTRRYERRLAASRVVRTETCAPSLGACVERCPLSLCIQGYVGHTAAGEYAEAFGHIASRVVLPETVCRVCHAPCEEVCVRAGSDGAVAINALKRFVVTWAAAQPDDPWRPAPEADHGRSVAVIGAGPSGLAAACELRMRGYGVTLFDAEERPGGMLAHGIPAYRLPPEALARDVERVLSLGIRFRGGTRLGSDFGIDSLLDGEYDAVYLALGAGRAAALDLPGTDGDGAPRVVTALEYLGRGRGNPGGDTEPRVVVVGGGNAALDAARSARRRGAGEVRVVCLEPIEKMPAIRGEIRAAMEEGVTVHPGLRPEGLGTGTIRFIPAGTEDGADVEFGADRVILAIGQVPDLEGLDGDGPPLTRTGDGRLRVDPRSGATSRSGVFAGGDLVNAEQTVTGAIADGLRAAWGIDVALRGRGSADRRCPPRPMTPLERIVAPPAAPARARAVRIDPVRVLPESRAGNFAEVVGTLTAAEAREEAARCLMCGQCGNCRACIDLFGCPAIQEDETGRVFVDPPLCTGCGVCAELCPNDAFRVACDG